MATTTTAKPALPYPNGTRILVFKDDGNWPEKWFMRANYKARELFVERWNLPLDDRGDCAMSFGEWCTFAAELVTKNPGCIFIY